MRISQAYIDGALVPVHGTEQVAIVNPATEQVIGQAVLADREDALAAVAAADRAQPGLRATGKAERIAMLQRLQQAVAARADQIHDATVAEYGAPTARARWVAGYAQQCLADTARLLAGHRLRQRIGQAEVVMEPVGVSALFTPWNSTIGSVCSKLASALAAGCASVVKPSELSPLQAQVMAEAIAAADLPPGAVNVVTGRGGEVGQALCADPRVARISFTGSTATGKLIARNAADSLKRLGLALSGKSATVILPDADLATAIPAALAVAWPNNGQACVAGSRLLVPQARLPQVLALIADHAARLKVGDPCDPATDLGPLASQAQYQRIQQFIQAGLDAGAELVVGGLGRPTGLEVGHYVRPTVFAQVDNGMRIAREEIFGPVLCVIAYADPAQALAIANDSDYGLQGYVFGADPAHAHDFAARMRAGTVLVNTLVPELTAPFGGFGQSGLGREFGSFGIDAFLEPRTLVVPAA